MAVTKKNWEAYYHPDAGMLRIKAASIRIWVRNVQSDAWGAELSTNLEKRRGSAHIAE
jgi:hypothetical protein